MISSSSFIGKILKHPAFRAAAAGLILPAVCVGVLSTHQAQAAAGADCDNNAVIFCGAASVNALMNKYNNGDGHNSAVSIHNIFGAFGISSNDIQAMGSTAQMGSVTRSGNVFVGNQLVATNAVTAGRQNIQPGSTKRMNGGTIFFSRPPSVSFASSPLSAFVVMKNGVFQFAIIISCGNPVIGHPKMPPPQHPQQPPQQQPPKPAPKPAPKPKPAPSRTSVCSGDTTNTNSGTASQSGNCSTNTTTTTDNSTNNSNNTTTNTTVVKTETTTSVPPEQPAPPPTPTDTSTPAPAEQTTVASAPVEETQVAAAPVADTKGGQLPNTGVGDLVGIFAITSAIGTIGYRLFLGRYLRRLEG